MRWFPFLLFILTLVPCVTSAQECLDWPPPQISPFIAPQITGTQCEVVGSLCYVMGDFFRVVDISDPTNPVELAVLEMTSTIEEFLVLGDRFFVILDAGGLWEIDVSDSSNPILGREYNPGAQMRSPIEYLDWVVVLGGDRDLHFLDVDSSGPIAPVSVFPWERSCHGLGSNDDFLFINEWDIEILDFSDPFSFVRKGSVGSFSAWAIPAFKVEEEILSILDYSEDSSGWINGHYLRVCQIDEFGQPGEITRREVAPFGQILTTPNHVVIGSASGGEFFDPMPLSSRAKIEWPWEGFFGFDDNRLCLVSPENGLASWDMGFLDRAQPQSSFVNGGGPWGGYWLKKWSESDNGGAGGGGEVTTRYYEIYDISNLESPSEIMDFHWSSFSDFNNDSYSLRLLNDRWLPYVCHPFMGGSPQDFDLYDLSTGAHVASGIGVPSLIQDGRLWTTWNTESAGFRVRSYDFHEDGSISNPREFDLGYGYGKFIKHDQYLLYQTSAEVVVFDASQPDELTEICSHEVDNHQYYGKWIGMDLFTRRTTNEGTLFHYSFSDPLSPPLVESISFDGYPHSIQVVENGLVIELRNGSNWGSLFVSLDDQGFFDEISTLLPGRYSGAYRSGDFLYLNHAYGLNFFDVSSVSQVQLIGIGNSNDGGLAMRDGMLIAGGNIIFQDCDTVGIEDEGEDPGLEPDDVPQPLTRISVHPNPFNPKTTISFTVDYPQIVELSIYDLSGNFIANLAQGWYQTGTQNIHWEGRDYNGNNLASGAYLVQMVGDDRLTTKKVMLIR